jgi:hypothetical protein
MSSGWGFGGLAAAGLGLIVFEVLVTSSSATGLASLAAWPGKLAASWMNPAVALIPDKSTGASSTSASSTAANSTAASSPSSTAAGTLTQTA